MEEIWLNLWSLGVGFCIIICVLKWNDIKYRRKGLPPGSLGFPLFGETTQFLNLGPDFMTRQKLRYGPFFKTHILGSPAIICIDPKINRYILLNESKGLVPGYPQPMLEILGKHNIAAVHGATHKYIRGSILSLMRPSVIKDQLLPKIDRLMRVFLSNWDGQTVDIQQKTNEMTLFVAFNQVMDDLSDSVYEAIKFDFDNLLAGTLALPINFPGTKYYRGFQARKRILKILKQIMKERRTSSTRHSDMLNGLLKDEESKCLNDEEILDQVLAILNAGFETVSTTSMMILKYLHDNPKALQQLREEHIAIRQRKAQDEAIDWNEYKSMKFTHAVIYEASRLATVVNGLMRKTTEDIKLNGYIIPKGWRIYVYTRENNYDPSIYSDPLTFNPSRWLDDTLKSHEFCFLFGAGTRLCPGKELAITKISIFLHYFVTKYRWEEVGGEKIVKFPRVEAPNGLHIRVNTTEFAEKYYNIQQANHA